LWVPATFSKSITVIKNMLRKLDMVSLRGFRLLPDSLY
jgi:hypothetical protein